MMLSTSPAVEWTSPITQDMFFSSGQRVRDLVLFTPEEDDPCPFLLQRNFLFPPSTYNNPSRLLTPPLYLLGGVMAGPNAFNK